MSEKQFETNTNSLMWVSRKNTFRNRNSHKSAINQDGVIKNYSLNELKLLVMMGLIKKFVQQKENIVEQDNKQAQQKLKRTGIHFNRISSTLSIQPIKKSITQLKAAASFLQKIAEYCQSYFLRASKRQSTKKLTSYKIFNIFVSLCEGKPNFQHAQKEKVQLKDQKEQKNSVNENKQQKNEQQSKQNSDVVILQSKKVHKKYHSDLSLLSKTGEMKRQMSQLQRKRKAYVDKKKQQINFFKKISVQFNSQESEFKVLMDTMEIFVQNMNRSNYYLKMIDHNQAKCQKVIFYIQDLNNTLQSILQRFQQISKLHACLVSKQPNLHQTVNSQTGKCFPSTSMEKYYQKCEIVVKMIRHFCLSPTFCSLMPLHRGKCVKLVRLFVEARYSLRYLNCKKQTVDKSSQMAKSLQGEIFGQKCF